MSQSVHEPSTEGHSSYTNRRPTRPAGNHMADAVENLEARPIGARAPDVHALRRQNFARRATIWAASLALGVGAVLFVVRVFGGSAKKQAAQAPVAEAKSVAGVDDNELQLATTHGTPGKDSALASTVPVSADSLVFKAPTTSAPQSGAATNGDPRVVGGTPAASTGGAGGVNTTALPGGTADGLQLANGQPSRSVPTYGGDTPVPRFTPTTPTHDAPAANDGEGAPAAPHALTRSERFARIQGSIGGMSEGGMSGDSPFSGRRSALADGASADEGAASGAPVQFVPGTRVQATIHTPTPSGTSGEPIEAVLDAPLRNRGRVVAPAGTRAIGRGSVFDDGTGHSRLLITFTTFVLPDDRVLSMTGTSYSIEDNRPGLNVPINRQLVRKGKSLGVATGLAYGVARVADKITGNQQQSAFMEPSVGQQVAGQALQDVYTQAKGELGVQSAPTGVVLAVPRDQRLLIVFGLGQGQ